MKSLLTLPLILLCCAAFSAESERPNILFLFADDWGRHASAYAQADGPGSVNDVISTPHFDELATSGVLFLNAHVNAPSCTPCRSSLLSGQHFWRTGEGAILQGATWDASIPTYPLLLEKNGYDIGYCYKVWSPGNPANGPIGQNRTKFQKAGGAFNGFSQTATKLIAQGKSVDEAKAHLLREARGNFSQFLDARKGDTPWAFWFGPTNVHRKWIAGSGKKLWGIDPDDLKGKMPPFLPDVHTVREDLADYFGEAMAFDRAIGELVAELKKRGEYENTIIAISGDHGAPGFPHGKCNLYSFGTEVPLVISGPGIPGGRVVNDLVSLPDLAPTFLEAGNTPIPDVMTARSLWPTLSSPKAGWVDPERTQVYIGRERHVAKARAGREAYPQRAIRTKDHLLIINFKPDRWPLGDPFQLDQENPFTFEQLAQGTFVTLPDEDAGPTKAWIVRNRHTDAGKPFFDHAYSKRPRLELYDLATDPHQMANLAGDPAFANIQERLEKQLMAELKQTNDPRLVNDGAYFEDLCERK